jgi:hypoxanthine-DNA glycosylase
MTHCIGFEAVAAQGARVLILGSLPGAESLRLTQYYAMRTNAFWWIMGQVAGAGTDIPYEERLRRLTGKKLALWDVCRSAERPGSLDSNIRQATVIPNDFGGFLATYPTLAAICFNGRAAEKLFCDTVLPGLSGQHAAIQRHVLPSTSPAFAAMRREEKLMLWRQTLGAFVEL